MHSYKSGILTFLPLFSFLLYDACVVNSLILDDIKPANLSEAITYTGEGNELTADFSFKPKLCHYDRLDPSYSYYYFYVPHGLRSILAHPNKLEKIQFGDVSLTFSDEAILSSQYDWPLITVYTCKHNNPLLISMYKSNQYTFYSLDKITNTWVNHDIVGLKKFEHVDKAGVKYYKYNKIEDFRKFVDYISFDCSMLSLRFCKNNKCAYNSLGKTPSLQLSGKLIELPYEDEPLVSLSEVGFNANKADKPDKYRENDTLIKNVFYHITKNLIKRLNDQYDAYILKLHDESIKIHHQEFIDSKNSGLASVNGKLNITVFELFGNTEPEKWTDPLPLLSTQLDDLKSLLDDVNSRVQSTLSETEAEVFANRTMLDKVDNFLYLLNGYNSLIEDIALDYSDSKLDIYKREFEAFKLNAESLADKFKAEGENDNLEDIFKDIVEQSNKASGTFKKIINTVANERKDNGVEVDKTYLTNITSFIDKITNISNATLPGLISLLVSASLFLI